MKVKFTALYFRCDSSYLATGIGLFKKDSIISILQIRKVGTPRG